MTVEEAVTELAGQLADRIAQSAPEVRNPWALANRLLPDALAFAEYQLSEMLVNGCDVTDLDEGLSDLHWRYCVPLMRRVDELAVQRQEQAVYWS